MIYGILNILLCIFRRLLFIQSGVRYFSIKIQTPPESADEFLFKGAAVRHRGFNLISNQVSRIDFHARPLFSAPQKGARGTPVRSRACRAAIPYPPRGAIL